MATLGAEFDEQEPSFLRQKLSRLARWIGSERSIRTLEIASIFAFFGVTIATSLFLTHRSVQSEPLSPASAAALLVANLLPATTLLVLFGRRLALRRAGFVNVGSKELLHVRLVAIFSLIAAVPTLLLVIFASLLFQSGVQFWFSGSARDMLNNAGLLAKGYSEEKVRDVSDETTTMADDFRTILNQTKPDSPAFLGAYVEQVLGRKLSESAIVTIGTDGIQRTLAVVSPDDDRREEWIDDKELKRLKAGENLVVSVKPDRIDAVTILYESPRTYLYTSRTVNVPSYQLGARAQSVLRDYETMVSRSRNLQFQFNAALYLVSLLIIGITVWVALLVADRLVRPVTNLVQAAQKIADGDLSVRVPEDPERLDEVGYLSQSFNLMTDRLQSQTSTLLTANRQLDERRAFIEAVLESVSAGIISLDNDGNIRLANSTAEKLLATNQSSIVGHSLKSVLPQFAELLDIGQQQAVVQIGDEAEPLTVAVKISQREGGHVVTFEDISQQLADQRRAAWSDVARRIAHEIKNPLTPIQLAAERLQRRFGKQIQDGAPIFEQLTGTIVRQVGDLRNIVDEFSSFARMPKPVLRQESIIDIVGHAVFLHEVAHTDISFAFEHDREIPPLICDRRQLGQAITNILKNAVEAVQERKQNGNVSDDFRGLITAKIETLDDHMTLSISDNGTGLPKDRDRILEPYVTTRATGSGLGLAIVKKIIEEHFAEVSFSDAEGGGAMISIRFSPKTLAARASATDKHFIQQTDIKDKDQG
jgi:two-component system, NtrC family, nitrogen regulation sensor histidine kinase NtrY